MIIKYNANFSQSAIDNNLRRIINQVYKLLPMREQNKQWEKPLQTIIQELVGMKRLFLGWQEESFLVLLRKLEGIFELQSEDSFAIYRRTIFQCLSLLGELKKIICQN